MNFESELNAASSESRCAKRSAFTPQPMGASALWPMRALAAA